MLSLFVCYFEGNEGSSGTSHIYFERKCIFSASDCLFVLSTKSSILFAVDYESIVNLSFHYFKGFGLHLSFPQEEGIIVFNVHDLCFDNSRIEAISGFFPKFTDDDDICSNCPYCELFQLRFQGDTFFSSSDSSSDFGSTSTPLSNLSVSEQVMPTSQPLSGGIIALIVVSPLIGIGVVVIVGLWMLFRHKSRDKILPNDLINPDLEMVSINRSSNTELPPSGDSIENENSAGNSSSDFEFAPDLEEIQA
jgi:hypothetical protein